MERRNPTMNAPTQTYDPVATLQAECDVLRLMVVLMLRREISSEFPMPEMGIDVWAGEHMAAVVAGLSGPNGTPGQVQAHLDALARFGDALRNATDETQMLRSLAGRQFRALHATTGGDD
jgi:hypothetical protein